MENIQPVSDRVKNLLSRTGMKSKELADRLGVTENYISQLKTGKKSNLGELREMRLRVLEDSPIYQSSRWREQEAREPHSMGPPHVPPRPSRQATPRDDLPHADYAAAVNMIGHLFEHHPEAFQALLVTIKAFHDANKSK